MTLQNFLRLSLAGLIAAIAIIAIINPALAVSRAEIKKIVVEEAQNSSVPPALALAVAKVESDFNPTALSTAGARGVMQLMPKTAKDEFGVDKDELWQARLNIQLGIDYLAKLRRQYGGNWELALSHYNGGTLKGKGSNAEPHEFTKSYVRLVQRWQQRYAEQNKVWAIAFNDDDKGDKWEQRWKKRSNDQPRVRWDDEKDNRDNDRWVPLNQNRRWNRFGRNRGRDYAWNDFDRPCRKSGQKAAWREYDQFSSYFNGRFDLRYAGSNTRIRTSWISGRNNRGRRYRRDRSYRPWRYDRYANSNSTLEDRRLRAAHTLDDFSSSPRRRNYWRNG
tara:strand:- start:8524 stop:9525 length:1002 start_codon:yes stop_codon:yes gene_type:complete